MKKGVAILLIAVMLFNIAGYRFVFHYLEQKSTAKIEKQIDAGAYTRNELLEVKVALNVPYAANTDYGPHYGETVINGQHYQYVQSKVQNDTLYLLCLPHTGKDQIAAMKKDFLKEINDHPAGPSPAKNLSVKLMLSEFLPEQTVRHESPALHTATNYYIQNSALLSQSRPLTGEQPPEA